MTSDTRRAWGYGLATIASDGTILDTWFPSPVIGDLPKALDPWIVPAEIEDLARADELRDVTVEVLHLHVDLDEPPQTTQDAYLRLHLLSHCLATPNSINLDGIFALLPTVAWTNAGPVAVHDLPRLRPALRRAAITITSVDKFPRLTDYLVPEGVRIADASRVRLGAYLAPGTTVMHEGFVNFNAGTLGACMVEGRISQGVTVGEGTDIGGGASIMGTLSGGGEQRISIGRGALLGANSGVGISIGDNSVVEAGLYVTAGTKVHLPSASQEAVATVKARELSGVPDLLFRRNSLTGAVEVLPRKGRTISLNPALHT